MTVTDKHGEGLRIDDRVMVDGGLVGEVLGVDHLAGKVRVRLDGEDGWTEHRCKPTGWEAPMLESLGDGINQAMRAAKGQPS